MQSRGERTRTSDILLPKQVPWPLGNAPKFRDISKTDVLNLFEYIDRHL